MKENFGIYIHWPFCLSKCPYCDFYSCPSKKWDADTFYNGYLRDLNLYPPRPVSSVFFGGGTPSLMPVSLVERILNTIDEKFGILPNAEISMEANPDAIDKEKMLTLKNIGINRLSLGVQALNSPDLKKLGRLHSLETALARIEEMQSVFPNHSIDLIYTRPDQSLADWEKELRFALSLNLPHLSLYQLTIEDGTAFARRNIILPDDETVRQMYLLTLDMTEEKTPFYEVSNFAKKGFECRHNLLYWRKEDYIGIGPAAHGRIQNKGFQNPPDIQKWMDGYRETENLSDEELFEERLIMGLRLREGISDKGVDKASLLKATQQGWISHQKGRITPTPEGFLMLNKLILLLAENYPS
ncbi:MAG: radical SAM family heme chaperone HemW [Alphaproteobacteria bacterium]|nr:radical SAM family heme chaperone HemW [Alphaproteobacteria bacterium]